jgi:hypothetical protein
MVSMHKLERGPLTCDNADAQQIANLFEPSFAQVRRLIANGARTGTGSIPAGGGHARGRFPGSGTTLLRAMRDRLAQDLVPQQLARRV